MLMTYSNGSSSGNSARRAGPPLPSLMTQSEEEGSEDEEEEEEVGKRAWMVLEESEPSFFAVSDSYGWRTNQTCWLITFKKLLKRFIAYRNFGHPTVTKKTGTTWFEIGKNGFGPPSNSFFEAFS